MARKPTENVRARTEFVGTDGARNMKADSTYTGKRLGADCGGPNRVTDNPTWYSRPVAAGKDRFS